VEGSRRDLIGGTTLTFVFRILTYCQILVHVLQAVRIYSLNVCDVAKCS